MGILGSVTVGSKQQYSSTTSGILYSTSSGVCSSSILVFFISLILWKKKTENIQRKITLHCTSSLVPPRHSPWLRTAKHNTPLPGCVAFFSAWPSQAAWGRIKKKKKNVVAVLLFLFFYFFFFSSAFSSHPPP